MSQGPEDKQDGIDDRLQRVMGRDGFSPDLPDVLAPQAASSRLGLRLRLMMYMLRGLHYGQLEVNLPNGERRLFRGQERTELRGVLNIRDERFMSHVLSGGEVGFGEAYLDGCWDSPDLAPLLAVMYLNEPYYKGPFEMNWLGKVYGWWQHRRRANTRAGSRENIQHHYDLGNDFYQLWLDDTMAYSSAMFAEPNQTLHDAQLNKFRLMYERLELKAEHHLLEIGSGWGGFAIYAAQHSGCRVTSITLSDEQLKEARRRAEQAGVADRVHFELRDYRDIQGQYDRVVSIEMYEAVGAEYWPGYFTAIEKALKPGGRAAIQGITIDESIFEHYLTKRDFIQKYIFPGGMLCPPQRFMDLAQKAGLQAREPRYFGHDYADTLAHWHRNVLAVRDQVVSQFDERFLRMWRYYLAYCECGFRVERIDLMQVTLEKE
ncbi:MAG TPA: cyclopropane-fatty-acyl-phospholipid synthase family protein [Solimonas sp.]